MTNPLAEEIKRFRQKNEESVIENLVKRINGLEEDLKQFQEEIAELGDLIELINRKLQDFCDECPQSGKPKCLNCDLKQALEYLSKTLQKIFKM